MAEALVAGPVLSAVFNVLFEKMASKEVVDFFKQRKLNDEVLQKLKRRMNTVSGLLEDAEEKQITKPAVRNWLDDLKDVAYEADDLLDEIANKAGEKQHLEAGPKTCSNQVRIFFSSLNPCRKGIGELQPEMEKILVRIEDLLQQKDFLNLEKSDGAKPSLPSLLSSQGRLTTSLVDESGIYGRDDDKETIIKLLLTDDERLGVVPIVGMGGVGKTTISQLIYRDSRVKQRFDKLKAWVCVSEEFDVLKMTKNILKEIGSSDCDSKSPNALQLQLEEKVKGEKILLVLDDVWNDNYADWEFLLAPLKSAAQGSKVLVTTREEKVASVMSTVPSYHLKELREDDCWLLFAKHAFDGHNSDVDEGLKEPGRKIVRKCKGLPLAAKTVGSLLRLERRIREWEKISQNTIWDLKDDKIIPALRLSYHYLPPHLKQCFVYCAMFPKDFEFTQKDLILLWMAEGFIVQNNNKRREIEEIGEEYFEDLLSKSFFQKHEFKGGMFVMHDLINDLAKSIAGEFCYNNVDDSRSGQVTKRTRHLFYKEGNECNVFEELENILKAECLRTFICSREQVEYRHVVSFLSRFGRLRALHLSGDWFSLKKDGINISHLDITVKHLRYMQLYQLPILNLPETMPYLQTLIITQCPKLTSLPDSIGDMKDLRHLSLWMTGIKSLPDSIGNLKNLRHLNLLSTRIKSLPNSIGNLKNLRYLNLGCNKGIERLPESICGLHSLQHLSLSGCLQLVEFPAKMSDLVNLCHLDIRDTKLKSMPSQMGKLIKLQTLSDFIVGKEEGSSIAELGYLRNLEGRLRLRNLQNVGDEQDTLKAKIKDKSPLKELEYVWKGNDNNNGIVDRSLLQHLEPHVSINSIVFRGYRGIDFPNWVGDSSFSNIVHLRLKNCKYCTRLPPLGQLASLQNLQIYIFNSIVSVGAEFYGSFNSIQPFRSLRELTFDDMPKLQQWSGYKNETEEDDVTAFPLLEDLTISNCLELEMALIPRILPSTLKTLTMASINKMSSGRMHLDLHKLSSLSQFSMYTVADIESFPGMILLPCTLRSIWIRHLQNLKYLDYIGLHHLTSLTELHIRGCPNLECIPDEGLPESLTHLYIKECPLLEKRCRKEQGEDWPKISRIQNIYIDNKEIQSTEE